MRLTNLVFERKKRGHISAVGLTVYFMFALNLTQLRPELD